MLRSRTAVFVVVASLLSAPMLLKAQGTGSSATPGCAAGPSPHMTVFDTSKVADLVGAYDVVMLDTTSIRGIARQHTGKLALWMQDSVPRRRGTMARKAQKQFLVGMFDAALPDTGEMWTRMASRTSESPGAIWSDGFIRLGDFGAKNGISLYPQSVSPGEIRGIWSSNPGIGIVVDFTGPREPDEAGYFCAKRSK